MSNYLCVKGINLETTAPYTPEQNGRAERDNRTLVESARAMLHAKNLPICLWAEAINTACYTLNRTPTSCNQGKTPYEMWTGRKPRLDHIKVFGSEAYVHVAKQSRKKWDKKSQKMILVGYQANSCNYRLYNPQTGRFMVSRDVVIHETDHNQMEESNDKIKVPIDMRSSTQEEVIIENVRDEENEVKHHEDEDEFVKKNNSQGNATRELRNRNALKSPDRYEANIIEFEEPILYEDAISGKDAENWKRAIDEELKAHKVNNTWIYQRLPKDKKTIESKWVFKIKHSTFGDSYRYKARLCAKGFTQKQGIDYHEIFSPVARYDSIRVMLAIAAKQNLEIAQFDVKTAFLNGDLSEEIYMKIPQGVKEAPDGTVCRLQRSLYGLKQASREWNSKFDLFLKRFQFIPSKADPCVYNGKFEWNKIYLIIYVDDGLILSTSKQAINRILTELKSNFEITLGNVNCYVGIEIVRDIEAKTIFIHQSSYIKRILQRFNMLDTKIKEIPADLGVSLVSTGANDNRNNILYRQAIGSLMFLANVTRPDISFIVNYLSRFISNYDEQHWRAINNVFRYLKGTIDMGILYDGSIEDTYIKGYSDADYAGDLDTRRSTSGYLIMLGNAAVTWGSIRQRTVSLSTKETEYIAACESVKEALWLKQLLHDNEYVYVQILLLLMWTIRARLN